MKSSKDPVGVQSERHKKRAVRRAQPPQNLLLAESSDGAAADDQKQEKNSMNFKRVVQILAWVCVAVGESRAQSISINLGGITTSNGGVFTNTQMNEYDQSLINSCSPSSEWTNIGQSGFNTDALTGCLAVPVAGAVVNGNAVAGYGNNSSTTTNTVAGYFQVRALAANTHDWGANPVCSDGGFATTCQGLEVDVNIGNTASTGHGIQINGSFTAQPAGFQVPALTIFKPGANQWSEGLEFKDGAFANGGEAMNIGTAATGNNQFSQFISYTGRDSGGTTHLANTVVSPSGDYLIRPGTGVATFLNNSAAMQITEAAFPGASCAGTVDIFGADSTAHRFKMCNNGGGAVQVVASGVDINTSDQVTVTHLAAALPVAQGGTGVGNSTTAATVITQPDIYNAAGTLQTGSAVHLVQDTCTLGTNCGITLSGSAAYTSAISYTCTCHDQTTPLNACGVNQTGGGALTITGTGTDVIRYMCAGN